MAYTESRRPIPAIFADLLTQLAALVRTEGQLARAEMSEKFGQVGVALGLVIAGAVALIPALVILLQAAVAALVSAGLRLPLASLAVGGATLVISVALVAVGVVRLKAQRLLPSKTIRQLQRDAALARAEMRTEHGISERAA
jgi:Putative Actinobacterial Holin-X, holin superfamily III